MRLEKELNKIGIKPVEGQHFLRTDSVIKALVTAGEVEDQTVIEIGPGTGQITEELAEEAEKVYAVETDTTLANYLGKKIESEKVEVVEGDFLEYDIPDDVTRCVSNLPFQITSDTLEKLGKAQIQSALIIQKEVAEKITADPSDKNYGFPSVKLQYYFIPVKLRDISRRHYYPQPEVETSIVKLYPNKDRHGVKDEENFFKVTKALFNNKRKKVRNSFEDSRHILGFERDKAKELKDELPHSEERVVNLEIQQFREIAGKVAELKK